MTTKKFPTLYGMSSTGKVKVWDIEVNKIGDEAIITIKHGQHGGKIQVSPETIREGKNIGRSNETSVWEQACLEAESKWTKQHDKNYSESLPSIDKGMGKIKLNMLPMLAQKYKERSHHLVWPAYVQPKLNGVRCLVERKGNKIFYWSRKAKPYKNISLIMDKEFLSFMKDGDVLDGEIYNHGDVTFQELISLVKNEETPDLESLKKYVKFWCYDRPDGNKSFRERYNHYIENDDFPKGLKYFIKVPTFMVRSDREVKEAQTQFVLEGYEGTMVRSGGDEPYRFQYRDNQLQKYKDFLDEEFVIVGCKEGTGKDEGKAIFRCRVNNGLEFDVRCKGSDAIREEQWKNRNNYLNKLLTVRFQTFSDSGIPIFPVGICVRDYE